MSPVTLPSGAERYDRADRQRPSLYYPFETPHNRTITWDHMLRQVSDWEGTLWASRNGRIGRPPVPPSGARGRACRRAARTSTMMSGGMFINARDMARFGYLTLRRGKWKDRQLLSEERLLAAVAN